MGNRCATVGERPGRPTDGTASPARRDRVPRRKGPCADILEDDQLAPAAAQAVHAAVLAGGLGDASHDPGREREIGAVAFVPGEGDAGAGDVDLEQDRHVVLALGQAEEVEPSRPRERERQLFVAAEQVVRQLEQLLPLRCGVTIDNSGG